ncbi:MAG: substrate-binding domain-containing protein [Rubripirellula sp.]|nr:substrate-binding domain-containing protein [Rubripirellula sp.]
MAGTTVKDGCDFSRYKGQAMQQRGETTIQDIANHARVSKSTVSRVLNNSTAVNQDKRTAVLEAMQTLGFEPNLAARSLAGGRSMTLGVLTQNIGSPFYDALAQGVIRGLAGSGYSPLFVDGQWQQSTETESIRTLIGRRVDGLILIGGDVPVNQLNELRERLPTIVVARDLVGWENQCIHVDNVQAGYTATKHLISYGHERIALLRGIKEHPDATQRFEGYVKALKESGIEFDSDLIYQGDFSGQSGVMAVNALISKGVHFTAIFAANDMVAFGARLALSRHGLRVPEDISLIGFDDQAEAAFATPPLTTMKQPAVEMGETAAQSLVKLIHNEEYELACSPVELQIRESVARLR